MHSYGGLDTYGLTRTGRWKDPDSVDRYNHTEASWEARQATDCRSPKIEKPTAKGNRLRVMTENHDCRGYQRSRRRKSSRPRCAARKSSQEQFPIGRFVNQ